MNRTPFAVESLNRNHEGPEQAMLRESDLLGAQRAPRRLSCLSFLLFGLLLGSLFLAILLVLDVFIVDVHGLVHLGFESSLVRGTSDVRMIQCKGEYEKLTG